MESIITLAICILGMLGAFFLGTRKSSERMFESSKDYTIDESDVFTEPTEEEYEKSIKTWMSNDTNEETG